MGWTEKVVDGVTVEVNSGEGSAAWLAAFARTMEYEAEGLADREDMSHGFADSFMDADDVSFENGEWESGYVRNSVTPEAAGSNIVPVMTSNNSPSGYVADATSWDGGYEPYRAFNGVLSGAGSTWGTIFSSGKYISIQIPSATLIAGYTLFSNAPGMTSWRLEGSNDGSSWTIIDTRSGQDTQTSRQTYSVSPAQAYNYYRLVITASNTDSYGYMYLASWELIEPATPASINELTLTADSWTPTTTLDAVKVKLWIEDLDNSGAISVGNSGSDLVEAYLSYDSNTTFQSALAFSEEARAVYDESNIYIFTSDEVDLSTDTVTSIGLKIQSFDRGSGAPNIKVHGYLVVGKEATE